tara:strand:- start:51 stop:701 length:651 start_codon:yes stop_codon:yes gene_type:complete
MGASNAFAGKDVSLQEVPDGVRTTIEKYVGAGKLTEIERSNERGQLVYEVQVKLDGKKSEFRVSSTGEYLGASGDDDDDEGDNVEEQSVTWEQLPTSVQKTIGDALGGVKPTGLTKEAEDGYVLYEAAYGAKGAIHEIKLTDKGEIIESEHQIAHESLPPDVLAALASRFPNAAVGGAEFVEISFYELELKVNGEVREVKILANGHVLEDEEADEE